VACKGQLLIGQKVSSYTLSLITKCLSDKWLFAKSHVTQSIEMSLLDILAQKFKSTLKTYPIFLNGLLIIKLSELL
jgi:hypothetical protein